MAMKTLLSQCDGIWVGFFPTLCLCEVFKLFYNKQELSLIPEEQTNKTVVVRVR